MRHRDERAIRHVPASVRALLVVSLLAHAVWQWSSPRPSASAQALPPPPSVNAVHLAGLGEHTVAAQLLTLYLQAFDNQPGISIPFKALDYARVVEWLETILRLDNRTQYPFLLASHVYAQVPDHDRVRQMLAFVRRHFETDPGRRWRWLAHAAILAKHRLNDPSLALGYARDLGRMALNAPSWARQMHIFMLEDMGEVESAQVLLGALLASGDVADEHEKRFLIGRLENMKSGEKSSQPTKN